MSSWRKRFHERAPVHFDVEYSHAGKAGRGIGLNLSQKGMFVATERPPPPDAEVLLRFTPPGLSHPISVRARVTWVRAETAVSSVITGMGVQFLVYTLPPPEMAK
ncbi:MAG: PilZ domain-containing protein [Candidatus Methylomirabilales bacterium]